MVEIKSDAGLLLVPAVAADGPPDIRLVFLGEATPIDRALHAWRAAAQSGPVDPAVEGTLRERLWQPLANALPADTKRLFLALDGELALLPFEAIRLEDGRYLVEQFQVSYLSSGQDVPENIEVADAGELAERIVACAMPEKLAPTWPGSTSLATVSTAFTAVPIDMPGARLNDTVTDGS